ncbi:MAG: DNA repair protein RecN [Bacillota bacterium]|nr:DNA repair protein RecN [Bacillota bacterium]
MLKELQIKNFALIDTLELSFYTGFSVLSGETGAGKSIIIDALSLLLGARASLEMIRTGAKTTEVIGSFSLNQDAEELLQHWGMLEEEDLIIAREININGRNKCWINGRLATVGQLAELGPFLVDIVGQHDSQSLLNPQDHHLLLDAFGGTEHMVLLNETTKTAQRWLSVKAELDKLNSNERERNRRIDLLTFQVDEISKAGLKLNEDEELELERSRLANLDRIRESLHFVVSMLGENYEERQSLMHSLALSEAELQRATTLDPSLEHLNERFSEVILNLDDLLQEFRSYLEQLLADPDLLHQIELRLELIDNLRRKYGNTVLEILEYGQAAEQELQELGNAGVQMDSLIRECTELEQKWQIQAKELSESRKSLSLDLENQIETQLSELSMGNTKFKVNFTPRSSATPVLGGLEEIEFMMAPNLGEDLKPLAKIASGGELSRVMLAIKAILVEAEQTPTIIFDEIDAGIGGRTAVNLGKKLHSLGKFRQVLCVTHLPVIAGYGENHYSVQKSIIHGRTTVSVDLLDQDSRIQELTRMLGGTDQDDVSLKHAEELLRKTK